MAGGRGIGRRSRHGVVATDSLLRQPGLGVTGRSISHGSGIIGHDDGWPAGAQTVIISSVSLAVDWAGRLNRHRANADCH